MSVAEWTREEGTYKFTSSLHGFRNGTSIPLLSEQSIKAVELLVRTGFYGEDALECVSRLLERGIAEEIARWGLHRS